MTLDSATILECRKLLCTYCREGHPLMPGTWRHRFTSKVFGIPQMVELTCHAWQLVRLEHPKARSTPPPICPVEAA